MIRYSITRADLEARIEQEKPGWLARAQARTDGFRNAGVYRETSSIWSEVKIVYMRLQGGSKCAFCERKLESEEFGLIEQDVEHFRPKRRIQQWRVPIALQRQGVTATAVPIPAQGYHLLPYHVFNYAAACKPCNSVLKRDYFPIAGAYQPAADDPAQMQGERHFLIYPISDIDADPETLIGFNGTSPYALSTDPHNRTRALVTIQLFRLDDKKKRKNLHLERAELIILLFTLLEATTRGAPAARGKAAAAVQQFLRPELKHLNCAKSFKRLFDADPAKAEAVRDAAFKFFVSKS